LILRRKAAAPEPVDAHHRAGAGHLLEDSLHLVRVVGKFLDLGGAENRREDIAARIAGSLPRVAADLHGLV